jgi:hypothetical protein
MSSMLYLQMEPLFAPVLLWGGLGPSRGDCSPSEWILVRPEGCISLDFSQECQLEFAAVDVRMRASASATSTSSVLYVPSLTSALFTEAHRRRGVLGSSA